MLKWFRSFLGQRSCRVRYGTAMSKCFNLQTGLPQGSVTSCTLFNIFINDLILALKSIDGIDCLLFADDLVLWTESPKKYSKVRNEESLNKALEVLSDWCEENNMLVNVSKTAAQTFSLLHQNIQPELIYRGFPLNNTDKFTYLGVVFDTKLSWKHHIEYVSARFSKRLNILKRLAGCLWGCARTTLNYTYKTFILPVLTYCCEPLIALPSLSMQRLEVLQNQALRLITGAVKTTPIDAMLFVTKNRTIEDLIREKAIVLYEKLLRIGDTYWESYQNVTRNLKTQEGFVQRVMELRGNLGLNNAIQPFPKLQNPLDCMEIVYNLHLLHHVFKYDTPPQMLKILALETIDVNYPEDAWLHVYTDGSHDNNSPNVGAGIYCNLFSFYLPVGSLKTAFDGEVMAIRVALQQLNVFYHKFERAVILSDSQAAILSIASPDIPVSEDVYESQSLVKKLTDRGKTIVFQWIPGHCGLFGNEQADMLAKKGTLIAQQSNTTTSFHSSKIRIHRLLSSKFEQELKDRISTRNWNSLLKIKTPDRPRLKAVAAFRLITGHDCLLAHLFRIGVSPSPNCHLCGLFIPMDREHLLQCKALHNISECGRYWEARGILE